jgi:hypothetical protein
MARGVDANRDPEGPAGAISAFCGSLLGMIL